MFVNFSVELRVGPTEPLGGEGSVLTGFFQGLENALSLMVSLLAQFHFEGKWQMGKLYAWPRVSHKSGLNDVFQFADVACPWIVPKSVANFSADNRRRFFQKP